MMMPTRFGSISSALQHLDAIHPRHHQVAQQQVELLLHQQLEPFHGLLAATVS